MAELYDCIVLGVGGFGSAAFDHLAARGLRVLGLERFGIAHDRGSSHGHTRVTRQAYFEHPGYVPLARESYEMWEQLESDTGRQLLDRCGLLLAGPPDGLAVPGTREAARMHGIPLEEISRKRLASDFPGFSLPEHFEVVWEEVGGYLMVEACVEAHIERAVGRGAVLQTGETVTRWSSDGSRVEVTTDRGSYSAAALVITAGAWAPVLLEALGVKWEVVRKPLFWFPVETTDYDRSGGAGVFFLETPLGDFYGFPSLDGETVKVGEHTAGEELVDPLSVEREVLPIDLPPLVEFLENYMPGLSTTPRKHAVCLYTRTPDRHFIVDSYPGYANVSFGAGFSGHGFKFTPAVGAALADLAIDGTTPRPIEFLSVSRPGLL